MSQDRSIQVIQHRTFLQPQGLDHRQRPLHELAPRHTVTTEGVLPPQNAQTQDAFRVVVCGLDSLDRREQPQRRVHSQDVGAKGRRLGIGARATLLQNALEFPRNRVHPGLQARPVQFTAAERPPVGEQAFHDLQTRSATVSERPGSIWSAVIYLHKMPGQHLATLRGNWGYAPEKTSAYVCGSAALFERAATGGDTALGGDDIDQALAALDKSFAEVAA